MKITKSDFEKPKRDAVTEKLLNQFNQLDGPKGVTEDYRSGWDRIFGKKPEPIPLTQQDYENFCEDAAKLHEPGVDCGVAGCCVCHPEEPGLGDL